MNNLGPFTDSFYSAVFLISEPSPATQAPSLQEPPPILSQAPSFQLLFLIPFARSADIC